METDSESDIASWLASLVHRIISDSPGTGVRTKVRQHLLDGLASAYIGFKSEVFRSLVRLSTRAGEGCSVWVALRERVASADVGRCGRTRSTLRSMKMAAGRAHVIRRPPSFRPSLLCADGKNWDLIDRAAVAGYDVMVRLARGGNPRMHPKRVPSDRHRFALCRGSHGIRPSGTGLDENEKLPLHCRLGELGTHGRFPVRPHAASSSGLGGPNGITAALLAEQGHEGYPRIIEEGFYRAYLGHGPNPPVDHPLGHEYGVTGSYLKPYPGCRHLHPSIDAFSNILEANRISPVEIELIRVGTYKTAIDTEIHDVKSRGDAYFNIPYALAARAVLGRCDYDAFDENISGTKTSFSS